MSHVLDGPGAFSGAARPRGGSAAGAPPHGARAPRRRVRPGAQTCAQLGSARRRAARPPGRARHPPLLRAAERGVPTRGRGVSRACAQRLGRSPGERHSGQATDDRHERTRVRQAGLGIPTRGDRSVAIITIVAHSSAVSTGGATALRGRFRSHPGRPRVRGIRSAADAADPGDEAAGNGTASAVRIAPTDAPSTEEQD